MKKYSLNILLVVFAIGLLLASHFRIIDSYIQIVAMTIGINIMMSTSLNLVNGNMGEFTCGHAAFMLTLLQKERLLFIDRKPKREGGVAMTPIVTVCLKRFEKWVRLAREVLRDDFPQFETVQAFLALRLRPLAAEPQAASLEAERRMRTETLAKIAQMLRLDESVLTNQLFDHIPTALLCSTGTATATP